LYQQGETVTVNVSAQPAQVNVPSTIGMRVQQATQLLQAAGFQVQVNALGGGGGRVIGYSPMGQAPPGSTITLEVLPGGF
jgi:serine/threonine-protein kinase